MGVCGLAQHAASYPERAPSFPRRFALEFWIDFVPQKSEGSGKTGRWLHPQPGVQKFKAHQRGHHRFNRNSRPSLRKAPSGTCN